MKRQLVVQSLLSTYRLHPLKDDNSKLKILKTSILKGVKNDSVSYDKKIHFHIAKCIQGDRFYFLDEHL